MVGFDAPTIITALAIVFALYIISRMFLRKVSHSKEIEKLEHQIETEENDLKKALLRKKSEMQDLRRAIERADKKATTAVCSRIKAIIDAQEKELQKISSLDMEQVKHLRHLKIDTESMEGKTLADLVKLIEKEWGRPGSGREMDERYRALAKKDSHARGVGYLAMTFLHIHDFLNRIIALLDEEKRLLSGDVDINRLESVVSKESYEIELMRSSTSDIRIYVKQLDDLRVSPPEGPFLEVTGHPVDIIVSRKSSGMEHLGKGERIDLALLPERVLFGSDSHKCSIVMNHDTLAVAATLVRHAKGACAFMIEGGKGSILSDGAEFEAAGGYTFRFRKK